MARGIASMATGLIILWIFVCGALPLLLPIVFVITSVLNHFGNG